MNSVSSQVAYFYTITRCKSESYRVLSAMERRAASLAEEKSDVRGAFADNDRFGVGESASVDVDNEIACGQARERPMNAARKLIVRRARADRFADRKRQEIAHAQRRRERKGTRAADCDGVEVERNLHADHQNDNFCCIEELPAGRDK